MTVGTDVGKRFSVRSVEKRFGIALGFQETEKFLHHFIRSWAPRSSFSSRSGFVSRVTNVDDISRAGFLGFFNLIHFLPPRSKSFRLHTEILLLQSSVIAVYS
jgi:hypothetical protein